MTNPARIPRRDSQANRQALLDAARTLLARDPQASLNDIAAAAGLSRRTLYGHYATRDDLIDALTRQGIERLGRLIDEVQQSDPAVRLAAIADAIWRDMRTKNWLAHQSLRHSQMTQFADDLAPLSTELSRIASAGMAAGQFRTDVSPELLAQLEVSIFVASCALALSQGLSAEAGRSLVVTQVLLCAGVELGRASNIYRSIPEVKEPQWA